MNPEPGMRARLFDLPALAAAWLALAMVDLRLKALPYRWNRKLLAADQQSPGPRGAGHHDSLRMERIYRQVTRAASHPACFDMSCLRRAIVLRFLLRMAGIEATLVYGVRKQPGNAGILAHAWLDAGGTILDCGAPARNFTTFGKGRGERQPPA